MDYYYYNRSVAGIQQLVDYINHFKSDLYKVKAPILILQATNDITIEPSSAQYIISNVGSPSKIMRGYGGKSHVIVNDVDKQLAFKDILAFIREQEKPE